MGDAEDIIDFIKHLKKGFDKDLFKSKIDELAYVVETSSLEKDDFHTLFKLWLNLSIPITKWVSLGACLVPGDRVEERTVDYAFRWLLANCEIHANFSRMAFLLDWLTAAMDSDSLSMSDLDYGYEIFYNMLSFEVLTAHCLKLVYSLTKPSDVTRKRVLELLDLAKKREGKKNMYRQIQVLLGLFKSYKPECVPEAIPAISVHTSFKKINPNLLARFRRSQERRSRITMERLQHLTWITNLNSDGKNKKCDQLVPSMEFVNTGLKQTNNKEPQKNHLDFSDPASLLSHSARRGVARPARLRALLCNRAGLALLALAEPDQHAFLSHELHHLLTNCFLTSSPHSYEEKADLLYRLVMLQRTLLQGIPVISRFLAQYLPFWNERDYFPEILGLVEWISAESVDQVMGVVDPLRQIYHRAQPIQQCAIVRALSTMYSNLVWSTSRQHQNFQCARQVSLTDILPHVASSIADMCQKGLQSNPEDLLVLYSGLQSSERCSLAELRHGAALGALPRPLALALPLVTSSAALIDKVAALLILYKKIFSEMKSANKHKNETCVQQRKTLEQYSVDFINCLYHEHALSYRESGLVFQGLAPRVVAKLSDLVPEVDAKFSLRNNLAFAAYTYMPLQEVDARDADNKLCFDSIISHSFPNLSKLLMKTMPELRC